MRTLCSCAALCALLVVAAPLSAAESEVLLDVTAPGAERRLEPSSEQVTVARTNEGGAPRVAVTIAPGDDGYPGVNLAPQGKPAWDFSAFGRVEARLTNTGEGPITVTLRIDNAGDWQTNPWNGENVILQPGATGAATVHFGYSWGKPGYTLDPSAVTRVMLFTGRTAEPRSFRIESITAGGKPGDTPAQDPAAVRVRPKDGVLVGAGAPSAAIDAHNARASQTPGGVRVVIPAGSSEPLAWIRPETGRWDLRESLEVVVRVKNDGPAPLTPRLRLESNSGPTDWVTARAPLGAGASAELTIPFASAEPWNGEEPKESGAQFSNDAVSAVAVSVDGARAAERVLVIESARAQVPPPPALPDWLGQRPPVSGDWTMMFRDEFDGPSIDESKWNIYTENYWDERSHFSRDNVIVGDGVARLRFERKTGFHNDDESRDRTDHATGFLDSYGKWTQRYGYFEARVKLPSAPGLWPAFWLMPDRGEELGPQWVRASTEDGGMEFDIIEYLSRWGPYRYNIAMHWDGYGEEHQSIGSARIYVQPDADGFITAGLLWTPGSAVFYANGEEVARWEDPRVSSVPSYPIFTHVSGGWDNAPLEDARLPDDFVIDYIRVWQRADLAE